MNTLLNAIPRDGDYNSELWTTVDKDKTNIRERGMMKLIQGFSLYMVFMGKNFAYEGKTESRYRDLLIVCNVQVSVSCVWYVGGHTCFYYTLSRQSASRPQMTRNTI